MFNKALTVFLLPGILIGLLNTTPTALGMENQLELYAKGHRSGFHWVKKTNNDFSIDTHYNSFKVNNKNLWETTIDNFYIQLDPKQENSIHLPIHYINSPELNKMIEFDDIWNKDQLFPGMDFFVPDPSDKTIARKVKPFAFGKLKHDQSQQGFVINAESSYPYPNTIQLNTPIPVTINQLTGNKNKGEILVFTIDDISYIINAEEDFKQIKSDMLDKVDKLLDNGESLDKSIEKTKSLQFESKVFSQNFNNKKDQSSQSYFTKRACAWTTGIVFSLATIYFLIQKYNVSLASASELFKNISLSRITTE